jgi:hypothetical protein
MLRRLRAKADGMTESGYSERKRLSSTAQKASSGEEKSLLLTGGNPRCVSLTTAEVRVDDDDEEGGVSSWGTLMSLTKTVPPGRRTRAACSIKSFLCVS